MANEIGDGVAPSTTPNDGDQEVDVNALQEQLADLAEKNKQLFARAKKAEGFELRGDEWVKPAKQQEEPTETVQPQKTPSGELDYGQLAFYNTKSGVMRIEADEDVEFLKQTVAETGKSQQAVLSSNWFQQELKERAAARETANAIPTGKRRSGETGVTDVDIALARFDDTGELPQDFKTRVDVKNKILEREKSRNMFTGPSVIGPDVQQY